MRVIIIPGDRAVYVDGKPIEIANFDDLGLDPSVDSVVWDSGLKRGEVQYKRPDPTILDEALFNAMFIHCVAHHENVDMDLTAAEEKRRLADEAHTRSVNAKIASAEKKEATRDEKLAKLEADNEALKSAVAKLVANKS